MQKPLGAGAVDAVFIFCRCLIIISTNAFSSFFVCLFFFLLVRSARGRGGVQTWGMLTFLQLAHVGDSHRISIAPAVVGCIMTGFEVKTKGCKGRFLLTGARPNFCRFFLLERSMTCVHVQMLRKTHGTRPAPQYAS